MRNFVAKHMNSFYRAQVVLDKRDKLLEDAQQQDVEDEDHDHQEPDDGKYWK